MLLTISICLLAIFICLVLTFSIFKSSMPKSFEELKFEFHFIWHGVVSNVEDKSVGLCYNQVLLYKQDSSIAVLTGGNRGLGLRVLKKLLECEMTVILAVRNIEAARKSVESYINNPSLLQQRVFYETCDVGDNMSVRSFACSVTEKFPKINLLINNAGILAVPYTLTKDGFESQMAINYIGHFLLSHLLMPSLLAGANELRRNSRIVNVSSCAHYAGKINYNDFNNHDYYHTGKAYCDSKFAQVLFTKRINQLCKENNWKVQAHTAHPGIVDTEIFENTLVGSFKIIRKLFFKTPEQGARSILFAAIDPYLENCGGTFISNCRISTVAKGARDMDECKKFFNFSCNLLNIENFGSESPQVNAC